MDKIAETKKEIRLRAWSEMLAGYQASGKTVRAWCREQGMPVKTFYYRQRKVREAALEQIEQHQIVPIATQPIVAPASEPTVIRISGNGISVELPENISSETIIAVLRGLKEC